MVSQGDIIKVNFNPQKGHESAGFRPALVISNDFFIQKTNLAIVVPISNTKNKFPLHISLNNKTQTTGVVLCEHVRTLDLDARNFEIVEKAPNDLLEQIINVIYSEIDL